MASPPFDIAQTVPADNDITSQFPGVERTFRDIVESWLLVDGNTAGGKNKISFTPQNPDPTFGTGVVGLWTLSTGEVKRRIESGSVEEFGVPAGSMLAYAGATAPDGYLFAAGQAVSRTTYSRLFAAIGTAYGVGDGSTTFNLPDTRGRVLAAPDNMGGVSANRLTVNSSGAGWAGLNKTGGADTITLDITMIPAHSHGVNDPGHFHAIGMQSTSQNSATPASQFFPFVNGGVTNTNSSATGITIQNAGSGGLHSNTQPTITANYIIKW